MTDLTRSTARAIAETSRNLLDSGRWRNASKDARHLVESIENTLEEPDAPYWNIQLSQQSRTLAIYATIAYDCGDIDLVGNDGSMLLDPEGYDNTFGDNAVAETVEEPNFDPYSSSRHSYA